MLWRAVRKACGHGGRSKASKRYVVVHLCLIAIFRIESRLQVGENDALLLERYPLEHIDERFQRIYAENRTFVVPKTATDEALRDHALLWDQIFEHHASKTRFQPSQKYCDDRVVFRLFFDRAYCF